MHDKKSADPEVQRLRQRLDELEQQVKQLARVRQPKITLPPHGPLICISNEELVAGDTIELDILVFDETEVLVRSGELVDATDVFLNDADDPVETDTKMLVQYIDGRSCITGIYCAPADNVA